MAYQGEYFLERYGAAAAAASPPVRRMLERGLPVSGGTDATRVASYNPWVCLAWLVTGRTVGGVRIYPVSQCLDRQAALRMLTHNVTWFSDEQGTKGQIKVGQLADLMIPTRDYFNCPEEDIAGITSELTVVGGKVVYAAGAFAHLDQSGPPPAMPDWSPVRTFGGYGAWAASGSAAPTEVTRTVQAHSCASHGQSSGELWGLLGCACWAF
jgi:hypothetical protein